MMEKKEEVPTPDPTVLTSALMARELLSLREILEARLAGTDKEIGHIQRSVEQRQPLIDAAIAHLKDVQNERFQTIAVQFSERSAAVTQAFECEKNDIEKTERSTAKQIDAIVMLVQSENKAVGIKIDEINARLDRGDGRKAGYEGVWGFIVGGIGIVVGVVTLIILLMRTKGG